MVGNVSPLLHPIGNSTVESAERLFGPISRRGNEAFRSDYEVLKAHLVMAPIGAGLVVLLSFFAYFGGAPDRLLSFTTSLVLGVGMIEVINSYLVIRNARAASVQRTRTIMQLVSFFSSPSLRSWLFLI